MDELFLLPSHPVAMPRAYWLKPEDRVLSSQLVLIQPSKFEFDRIMEAIKTAKSNDYDMEIVNDLYKDSALILPHRPYDLLTGEFRGKNHKAYLGNALEKWDPYDVFHEAKFLHFSDWPVPKVRGPCVVYYHVLIVSQPWLPAPKQVLEDKQPKCEYNPATKKDDDCSALNIWLEIYADFKRRRKVCRRTPGMLAL